MNRVLHIFWQTLIVAKTFLEGHDVCGAFSLSNQSAITTGAAFTSRIFVQFVHFKNIFTRFVTSCNAGTEAIF
jgi:hypothetical protein